jgi:predicted kinase
MLVHRAARILAQGHSVIVDAVFSGESERNAIRDAAHRLKTRFAGLLLTTDLATRLRRVSRRERDASDATPEIARLQEQYDIGTLDWAIIDASGTPEQTLMKSRSRIAAAA